MPRFAALPRAAAALLLLPAGAAVAAQNGPVAPTVLPGGGVADPSGKMGFLPNPARGIDAVDLASGKLLWQSKEAGVPLLATADRLFVQAQAPGKPNQVRVLVFDTAANGKRLLESDPIVFPYWVSVPVTHGRSFASTAYLDGKGLLVVWHARGWYAGGAAPPPEIEKAARRNADGVARVDLGSGKVEALEGDKVPAGLPRIVPGEQRQGKVGGQVYTLNERPGAPPNPFQTRRTLQAADAAGRVLWEREVAAPIFLVPLP